MAVCEPGFKWLERRHLRHLMYVGSVLASFEDDMRANVTNDWREEFIK
jgi:hypothetical protein